MAERPKERRPGYRAFPRWQGTDGVVVDWHPEHDHECVDSRVARHRETGLTRLTFASHLRLVNCGSGEAVVRVEPTVVHAARSHCDEFGVEDPRITRIDDRYYMTYVAVSRHGAATALASTTDFRSFTRHGIIFPPENKDVVLFPDRFRGRYCALHRPTGATPFTAPKCGSPGRTIWNPGGTMNRSLVADGATVGRRTRRRRCAADPRRRRLAGDLPR